MPCTPIQSPLFSTPPSSKKRNPKYYGLYTSANRLKSPKLEDPSVTIFDRRLTIQPKNRENIPLITVDGGFTSLLSPNTLTPCNLTDILTYADESACETESDDSADLPSSAYCPRSPGPLGTASPALPASQEEYVRLTVRSLGFDDPGVEYYHSMTQSFACIFDDYARKLDYEGNQITLRYNGHEITRDQNPEEVGMEDEAQLTVYGKVPNMNLNTYFKVFVVQEADDVIPVEVNFRARLTCHMDRIYRIWASQIFVDHKDVILIRKSRKRPREEFVHESGIRNGDRLFGILKS